jgi:hypothetical protein
LELLPQTLVFGSCGEGDGDKGAGLATTSADDAEDAGVDEVEGRRVLLCPVRLDEEEDEVRTGVLLERLCTLAVPESVDNLGNASGDEMTGAIACGEVSEAEIHDLLDCD